MSQITSVGLAEAKDNLSSLTARANKEGRPFVILKNNKPWAEVRPIGQEAVRTPAVVPAKRTIRPVDLDNLFEGYEGDFQPGEDGFAQPMGCEEL